MKRVTKTAQGYQKQNGSWLGKESKSESDGIHNGKEVERKRKSSRQGRWRRHDKEDYTRKKNKKDGRHKAMY